MTFTQRPADDWWPIFNAPRDFVQATFLFVISKYGEFDDSRLDDRIFKVATLLQILKDLAQGANVVGPVKDEEPSFKITEDRVNGLLTQVESRPVTLTQTVWASAKGSGNHKTGMILLNTRVLRRTNFKYEYEMASEPGNLLLKDPLAAQNEEERETLLSFAKHWHRSINREAV